MPPQGDEPAPRDHGRARIGLCADCRFLVRQGTRRGAVFFHCARAEEDEAYPRYPPLPVVRCPGYSPDPRRRDGEEAREGGRGRDRDAAREGSQGRDRDAARDGGQGRDDAPGSE